MNVRELIRGAAAWGWYAAVAVLLSHAVTLLVLWRVDPGPLLREQAWPSASLFELLPIVHKKHFTESSVASAILLVTVIELLVRGVVAASLVAFIGALMIRAAQALLIRFGWPRYAPIISLSRRCLPGDAGRRLIFCFVTLGLLWSVQARMALRWGDYEIVRANYDSLIWPWSVMFPWFVLNWVTALIAIGGFAMMLLALSLRVASNALAVQVAGSGADPLCLTCGYNLRGTSSETCPECGSQRERRVRIAIWWLPPSGLLAGGLLLMLAPTWYPLAKCFALLIKQQLFP